MDPISSATIFGTVVSLLSDYVSQRHSRSDDEYKQFVAWLSENNHSAIISMLEKNLNTAIGIKALLNEDRQVLLQRFDNLDNMLASIASTISGFSILSESLRPAAKISEQALSILRQLDQSGGSKFVSLNGIDFNNLTIVDGGGGSIILTEYRFVEDDINKLVSLGLLNRSKNSSGRTFYGITRNAAALLANTATA
jgi:hypothetical protein